MNKHEVKDLEQIAFNVSLASTLSLFTGLLLFLFLDYIKSNLGILLVLPAFLQLNGSINGVLISKITSKVSIFGKNKVLNLLFRDKTMAKSNLILSLLSSLSLSIFAYLFNLVFFNINNPSLIFIFPIASLLTNFLLFPLDIKGVFDLYSHNIDPDNVVEAYITSITDIFSVISLFIILLIIS